MLDNLFSSILPGESASVFSLATFLPCLLASLLLGVVIALFFTFRSTYTKSFVVTLALMPAIVEMIILLVNGNLGTGVAVMGAFSLVRFRSAQGSAREICSLFLAMAVGLATGTGYIAFAVLFTLVVCGVGLLFTLTRFGEPRRAEKTLKITIPESLDYTGAFEDLFAAYTCSHRLLNVKTSAMGSLYKLDYRIVLRDPNKEKALMDDLRCRNGNLEISCGMTADRPDAL